MATGEYSSDMLREYQDFAEQVQQLLRSDMQWQNVYARYAGKLLESKDAMTAKRKTMGRQEDMGLLYCYTTMGAVEGSAGFDFDLRFLGQSVGRIKLKNGMPLLQVKDEQEKNSQNYFGYDVGEINWEDWKTGERAEAFRAFYRAAGEAMDKFPRQKEHMVESALFSELEKKTGATKALKGIQPVTCIPGVRLHMRTSLAASDSARGLPKLSLDGKGGDIDVFCRRHGYGLVPVNRSRLTVIEVKDENESGETFHLAIKQAIAYAVFIRELARSQCGPQWMELWGLGNQPWQTEGFTIDAVAAMPKGNTKQFPFAGMKLELRGGKAEDLADWIELHYIAFQGEDQPRDGQDIRFETSL